MNGSALLHYFRYFSKYSHWICIFDHHSNWNLQIDFLSQFSPWQVNNFLCVFLALISFHISEYWLKKSTEARVQRVFSSYSSFTRSEEGGVLKNKWYLISTEPKWLTRLPEVRHFSIYSLETSDTSPFVILIKNRGATKYQEREDFQWHGRYKWNLPRKRRRRQLREFLRRVSSQRLVLVGNVPERHAEWSTILSSSPLNGDWSQVGKW